MSGTTCSTTYVDIHVHVHVHMCHMMKYIHVHVHIYVTPVLIHIHVPFVNPFVVLSQTQSHSGIGSHLRPYLFSLKTETYGLGLCPNSPLVF